MAASTVGVAASTIQASFHGSYVRRTLREWRARANAVNKRRPHDAATSKRTSAAVTIQATFLGCVTRRCMRAWVAENALSTSAHAPEKSGVDDTAERRLSRSLAKDIVRAVLAREVKNGPPAAAPDRVDRAAVTAEYAARIVRSNGDSYRVVIGKVEEEPTATPTQSISPPRERYAVRIGLQEGRSRYCVSIHDLSTVAEAPVDSPADAELPQPGAYAARVAWADDGAYRVKISSAGDDDGDGSVRDASPRPARGAPCGDSINSLTN